MQAARGDPDVLRHRAIQAVAEPEPGRTEVVPARAALHAFAADLRRGLADDAIAFTKPAHGPARLRDGSAELVAEHHRNVDAPGMRVVRLMHVGAAHRHRPDRQQHIVIANVRNRNLTKLDGERFEGIVNEGGVGRHGRRRLSNREGIGARGSGLGARTRDAGLAIQDQGLEDSGLAIRVAFCAC